MAARSWLRAGLIALTAVSLVPGVWAYLFPQSFYSDVPTVAADPPYSQHLMTDVGAFFLAQAVVLGAAAAVMEYRLVRAALAGYMTFGILHLAYHAGHLRACRAPTRSGWWSCSRWRWWSRCCC